MPRLFAAIRLSPAAQGAIAAEQRRLADVLRGSVLRWVRSEHLHLTLVFLGDTADDRVAGIVQSMSADVPFAPFRMAFGGCGVFPSHGAPRALWLGIEAGLDEVVALQEIVASRLEALGVVREPRPFSPHLTLARWKEARRPPPPRDLGATSGVVAAEDVDAVTLFQSRLSTSGPTYAVMAESRLTGKPKFSSRQGSVGL